MPDRRRTWDREADAAGAVIPNKHGENQPEAPPTVITTRVNVCILLLILLLF